MTLGDYLIQAPGPSRESLISFMEANGYDPRSAFTSGDIPADLDGESDAIVRQPQRRPRRVPGARSGRSSTSTSRCSSACRWRTSAGSAGTKVRLFQDSTTAVADIRFLPQGTVAGRTVDARPADRRADAHHRARRRRERALPILAELGRGPRPMRRPARSRSPVSRASISRRSSAPASAAATSRSRPRIRSARSIAQFRGQLNTTTPNLADVAVQLPRRVARPTAPSAGGCSCPAARAAPANTQVEISFGDLTVTTDADGRFDSPLPIPAGTYTITATAPGRAARTDASASSRPAAASTSTVQLLGLGATTIVVRRPNGQPVAGALVALERGTFPGDRLNGTTDANGQLRFVNVSEGAFSVTAEEPLDGPVGPRERHDRPRRRRRRRRSSSRRPDA